MLLFFEKIGKGLFFCVILFFLIVKMRVNNMEVIMRKIMCIVVIGVIFFLFFCVMVGFDGVEYVMKMMNKSYCVVFKEEDVIFFRKDMWELKVIVEFILNSFVEGYDREMYVVGMLFLIDEVIVVESIVEKEGFDVGKIVV